MIYAGISLWILDCLFLWFIGRLDVPFFLISGFIFFASCSDFVEFISKNLKRKIILRLWSVNGLGLLFGVMIAVGIALTFSIFTGNDNDDIHSHKFIAIPLILGGCNAFYFIFNFLIYFGKIKRIQI